jgi:hypothetical protein
MSEGQGSMSYELIYSVFPVTKWHIIESASNRNMFQETYCGVKGDRAARNAGNITITSEQVTCIMWEPEHSLPSGPLKPIAGTTWAVSILVYATELI